jgi:hypothetical protein
VPYVHVRALWRPCRADCSKEITALASDCEVIRNSEDYASAIIAMICRIRSLARRTSRMMHRALELAEQDRATGDTCILSHCLTQFLVRISTGLREPDMLVHRNPLTSPLCVTLQCHVQLLTFLHVTLP